MSIFENDTILTGFQADTNVFGSSEPVAEVPLTPIEEQSIERVSRGEVSGSFTPTLGELGETARGEGGFWATVGQGWDEGLLGYSMAIDPRTVDFEEQERLQRVAQNYGERNGWSSFAASLMGRTMSDLPIDLLVGVATTGVGTLAKFGARGAMMAPSAARKIDKSVDALTALGKQGKPSYLTGAWDNAKRQFVEGMLAGAISETALQNMGKYGTLADIVQASYQDAFGGVVLGEFFRGVGYSFKRKRLLEDWSKAMAESTGANKADIKAELDPYLRELEEADALAREAENAQLVAKGQAPDSFTQDTLDLALALKEVETEPKAISELDNILEEAEEIVGFKLFGREERVLEEAENIIGKRREARATEKGRLRQAEFEARVQSSIEVARESKRRIEARIEEGRVRREAFVAEIEKSEGEFRAKQEQEYLDHIVEEALFVNYELNQALQILRSKDRLELPETAGAIPSRADKAFAEGYESYKKRILTEDFGRKILGSADDLQELSKKSGLKIEELEDLRQEAFKTMRREQSAKGPIVEPNPDAMVRRPAREGDAPRTEKDTKFLGGMQVRNAQELVDMVMHFSRGMADPKGYARTTLELFRARARIAGKSLEDYLADKAVRYMDTDGKSHIIFDDAETIIKASRNAEDMGDFFHEIGHLIEQDLTNADRRILANLLFPKNKGKLRDVNLFGRAFSETFANQFVTYLRQGVDAARFTKAEKSLFNKIADWLKQTSNAIFGTKYDTGPLSPKVQEVFDRLFKSEQVVDIELGRSDFVEAGRTARRGEDILEATEANEALKLTAKQQLIDELGKEPTSKQLNRRVKELKRAEKASLAGANAPEINEDIKNLTDNGEIENSPLAKSQVWKWLRENGPKIATTGVMTMRTFLENLGDTGKKLYAGLRAGKTEEFNILRRNYDIYRNAAEAAGFTKDDASKLKAMDDAKDIEVSLGGKKHKMGVGELINLHMYARDGINSKDGRSARKALTKHGYELQDSGDTVVLTDSELSDIGNQLFIEQVAGPEAVRAINMFQTSLRTMGENYNNWLKDKTGAGGFDPKTEYWMKKAKANPKAMDEAVIKLPNGEEVNIFTATDDQFAQMFEQFASGKKGHISKNKLMQTIADVTPINRVRKGGGIMQYQNPFHAMADYMHQQSRLMGMAEPLAEVQVILKTPQVRGAIEKSIGEDAYKAMSTIVNNIVGLREGQAPLGSKWGNRLYKGQVLSALSWNLSPILKQVPAIMSSLSRMDLPPGTNRFMEAHRLLKESIAGREKLHEEMMERFPTYHIRYVDSGVSPDMSDVSLSSHSEHVLFGDVSIADGFKGGFSAGFKNFVETGMRGIREADAATIRAVYLGVENNLRSRGEFNGKSPEQIDAMIEEVASEVIDETQGASHSLNRTVSQSSDNFFERQVAMFSSEATQQFNMALRTWNKWKQLPDGPEKDAAWDQFKMTGGMLAFNALGVAAAGSAAGMIKQEAFDMTLNSEEYQEQRDQYLENMGLEYARYKSQVMDAAVGIIPYSGPMMGEILKAYVIGDSFEQDLLPFGLFNDLQEMGESIWQDELGAKEILKNVSNLLNIGFGVPGTVTQAATSAVR